MKALWGFVAVLFVVSGLAVSAASTSKSSSKTEINQAVTEYFLSLSKIGGTNKTTRSSRALVLPMSNRGNENCEDDDQDSSSNSCVDAACEAMGEFGCDTLGEIREVGDACRGNRSGECLRGACRAMGEFGCDTLGEVREVSEICRSNRGDGCMTAACEAMGEFGCDTLGEVREVGEACRGVSGSCVKAACRHLGEFGCDTLGEIREVAASCAGN